MKFKSMFTFIKKHWVIEIVVIILIIVASILTYKYVDTAKHSAPYFGDKDKEQVLWSSKVSKLNDFQEDSFYSSIRSAVATEGYDTLNLDDDGLYVKKIKGKGAYYVEYISESSITGEKYKTSANIYLSKSDFRDDGKEQYNHFYTTIEDGSSYDSDDYNY